MTQETLTVPRKVVKAQLTKFIENVADLRESDYSASDWLFLVDPQNIDNNQLADLGVVLREKGIYMRNGTNGFHCGLYCDSITVEKLDLLTDTLLDFGFQFEDLLTMVVTTIDGHITIHTYKEKPYRHLTIQNGVCQEDDHGLLTGVFLDLEDGEYYINETLLLNKIEEDEE